MTGRSRTSIVSAEQPSAIGSEASICFRLRPIKTGTSELPRLAVDSGTAVSDMVPAHILHIRCANDPSSRDDASARA